MANKLPQKKVQTKKVEKTEKVLTPLEILLNNINPILPENLKQFYK